MTDEMVHCESMPVVGRATGSKISWADLTDSEFKAKKLNWADLSDEILTCSPAASSFVDTDTVSTEAPSPSSVCADLSSHACNESSDAEQYQNPQNLQSPTDFSADDMLGMAAWDLGDCWSWPNADWNDYTYQLGGSSCEIVDPWPIDSECYQFASLCSDGQAVIGDEPLNTPMQQAHARALAAALAHQQAVCESTWSAAWWQTRGVNNCSAHQVAYSKALEAARPLAKAKMQVQS